MMLNHIDARIAAAVAVAVALVAVPASAQKSAKDKKSGDDKPIDTITLTGCVVRSETSPTQFTLEDKDHGMFRLTGVKVSDYIGKPVIVIGTGSKKLAIVGGLGPDPNVAAQAGAIDPARAAVAAQTAAASPGNPGLPEFKVKTIRPAKGTCPE